MNNDTKLKFILISVALGIMFFMACNALVEAASLETTNGEIRMVQPKACPLFLCAEGDYKYSQVNQNNSEANLNNAQAEQMQIETTSFRVSYGMTILCFVSIIFGGALLALVGTFRKR